MASLSVPAFRPYRRPMARQHRWLAQFRGAVVVLEGNIGSGKTSLGLLLAAYLEQRGQRAAFLPEEFPAAELAAFYAHGKEHPGARNPHAFPFQMAMLAQRQRTSERAAALAAQGVTVLVDRGLYGDYCFAAVNREQGHLSDDEWAAYLARVYEVDLLEPTVVVLLDTPVDDCARRICMRADAPATSDTDEPAARARRAETLVPRDYLERIDVAHRRVLHAMVDMPVLTMPWGRDRHLDDPVERATIGTGFFRALEQVLHTDRDGARITVTLC